MPQSCKASVLIDANALKAIRPPPGLTLSIDMGPFEGGNEKRDDASSETSFGTNLRHDEASDVSDEATTLEDLVFIKSVARKDEVAHNGSHHFDSKRRLHAGTKMDSDQSLSRGQSAAEFVVEANATPTQDHRRRPLVASSNSPPLAETSRTVDFSHDRYHEPVQVTSSASVSASQEVTSSCESRSVVRQLGRAPGIFSRLVGRDVVSDVAAGSGVDSSADIAKSWGVAASAAHAAALAAAVADDGDASAPVPPASWCAAARSAASAAAAAAMVDRSVEISNSRAVATGAMTSVATTTAVLDTRATRSRCRTFQ